ncbi:MULTISPECIES: replication-relaxation family protein [unclassified Bacillus (in: firmicutes)]|uniref:replication-relaxation family protein n=1 Tax=unclassified Bacillus (in: firmicutes) TaxID=185979 RepID=UPI0020354864|nr:MULTISPECIES: replication-relaxation family protein [unclassified Bacillus (in: firmicutes)]
MKKLDYLTRSQIQRIHNLKSDRNAQRVLKQMEEYLSVMRSGENIYYLNAKGRALVNCDKVRKCTGNVMHYIMRNYLYIAYGCPSTWRNEIRIINEGKTKKDKVVCVADALFKQGDVYTVVEVDNTQTMKKNQAKIEKYRILKQRLAFGMIAPKFVWITTTEHRRQELMKLSEGLQTQVFTLTDFNA